MPAVRNLGTAGKSALVESALSVPTRAIAAADLEQEFQRLANIWRAETGPSSFVSRMVRHPAYQQVIDLGPAVIPLILRELASDPDYWFTALKALTGEDPTQPGDNFCGATDAWLRWGR